MCGPQKLPQVLAEDGRQPQLFLRLWAPDLWDEHQKGEAASDADAKLNLALCVQPATGRPLGISRVLGLLLASLRQEGLHVEGFNLSNDQPESSRMSASAAAKALPLEAHGWDRQVENALEAAEIRQKYYQELRTFAANSVDSCLRMRTQCLKEVDRLRQEVQRLQRLLQQQNSTLLGDETSAKVNVYGEDVTFFHVDDFLPPSWDEIIKALDEFRWKRSQVLKGNTPDQIVHSLADFEFFASRFSRKTEMQAQDCGACDGAAAGRACQDVLTTDAAVQTMCENDRHPSSARALDNQVASEHLAATLPSGVSNIDDQAFVAEDVSSMSVGCNQTRDPSSKHCDHENDRLRSQEFQVSSPARPRPDSIDECFSHSGGVTPGHAKTPTRTRPRPPVLMTPVANHIGALSVSHACQTPSLALFPVSSSSHASKSSGSSLPLGAPSPAWGLLAAAREQATVGASPTTNATSAMDMEQRLITANMSISQRVPTAHQQAASRASSLVNGSAPVAIERRLLNTGLPASPIGTALDGIEQRLLNASPTAMQMQSALQSRLTSESVAVQWSPQNALRSCRSLQSGRILVDSRVAQSPESARVRTVPFAATTPVHSSPSAAHWQSPTHTTVCKLPPLVPENVPRSSQTLPLQPTLMAMTTPPSRNHIVFRRPGRSWTTTGQQPQQLPSEHVPQPPPRRNFQQAANSVQLAQRTAPCSRTWGGQ